jgi:hypothetical protein
VTRRAQLNSVTYLLYLHIEWIHYNIAMTLQIFFFRILPFCFREKPNAPANDRYEAQEQKFA